MYLTHVGFALPLSRVARAFARDRATVGHACNRVEEWREDPPSTPCSSGSKPASAPPPPRASHDPRRRHRAARRPRRSPTSAAPTPDRAQRRRLPRPPRTRRPHPRSVALRRAGLPRPGRPRPRSAHAPAAGCSAARPPRTRLRRRRPDAPASSMASVRGRAGRPDGAAPGQPRPVAGGLARPPPRLSLAASGSRRPKWPPQSACATTTNAAP
jgi:hypothetical protein